MSSGSYEYAGQLSFTSFGEQTVKLFADVFQIQLGNYSCYAHAGVQKFSDPLYHIAVM